MTEPKPRQFNSRVRSPDGTIFDLYGIPAKGKELLCAVLVGMLGLTEKKRALEISDWRHALKSTHTSVLDLLSKINGKKEHESANAERDRIAQLLDSIAACSPKEQATRLDALRHNVVKHQGKQLATLPASSVGTPNWEASSKLSLSSSERLALQMGDAYERGGFETRGTPYPTAYITSRDDPDDYVRKVLVYAELVANQRPNAEPTPSEQEYQRAIAVRLGNPRSAAGPRTAQLLLAILALWLRARRDDNSVTVTINQLAEMMRYAQHKGSYRKRDLEEIRECWATISITRLSSSDGSSQGPILALNEYITDELEHDDILAQELLTAADRIKNSASARWTSLRVTPHPGFIRIAGGKRALLMGRDDDLNKLHPVNERADLLLGKRLEVDFRRSWNHGRGRVVRSVRVLLEGADLQTEKPRMSTLRRLESALEKLEAAGTIREWRDLDGRFGEALDSAGTGDRRLTESRWRSALESRIELEAGAAYAEHYRNFALKSPNESGLIEEIQNHLRATGRSQAMLAEVLGISRQYLSSILSGKRRVPTALEQRINELLKRESTLQLPLG